QAVLPSGSTHLKIPNFQLWERAVASIQGFALHNERLGHSAVPILFQLEQILQRTVVTRVDLMKQVLSHFKLLQFCNIAVEQISAQSELLGLTKESGALQFRLLIFRPGGDLKCHFYFVAGKHEVKGSYQHQEKHRQQEATSILYILVQTFS